MKKLLILLAIICPLFVQSQNEWQENIIKSVEYYKKQDYENAIYYGKKAVETVKSFFGNRHTAYGWTLNNLNLIYLESGKYREAKSTCFESYNLYINVLGKDHEDFPNALNNLTRYNREIQNWEAVDTLLQQRLLVYKNAPLNYAVVINDLAEFYREQGHFMEAEPLFRQSLEIYLQCASKDIYYAMINHNLGLLYFDLGILNQAEQKVLESIEIVENSEEQNILWNIIFLNSLGSVYRELGRYTEAEANHLKAIDLAKENNLQGTTEYLANVYNLGYLYYIRHDLRKAKNFLEQARDLCKKALGTNSFIYGTMLNSLAGIYRSEMNLDKALENYLQALEIMEGTDNHYYPTLLENIADVYYIQNNYSKAKEMFYLSNELYIKQIQCNFQILSENEKQQYLDTYTKNFSAFFNFAFDYVNQYPELAGEVFNNFLFLKNLIFYNSFELKNSIYTADNYEVDNLLQRWLHFKQTIINLSVTSEINSSQIVVLEDSANQIEKQLMNRLDVSDLTKTVSYRDIQQSINETDAVIEFVNFEHYDKNWTDSTLYCALVLRKTDLYPKIVFLCAENQLHNVLQLNTTFQNDAARIKQVYGITPQNNTGSDSLFRFVWQPLDSLLQNVNRVYISASGALHNVSFAAIPMNDSMLLSDKYQINYISSPKEILKTETFHFSDFKSIALFGGIEYACDSTEILQNARQYDNNLFAQVYPFFNRGVNPQLQYLQGTLNEVNSIQLLFDSLNFETKIFTHKVANEESFYLTAQNSPSILHISTHGFYFPQQKTETNQIQLFMTNNFTVLPNPLFRSGLLFAGAQRVWDGKPAIEGADDGVLTAYEVSQTWLPNTQLVVLSACQTGLGDVQGNEGVIGLKRAFKMASVDYLIVSLWSVPDFQTQEMMTTMYQNFTAGNDIETAFRNAQNQMRQKYSSPFYWAGFVLVK